LGADRTASLDHDGLARGARRGLRRGGVASARRRWRGRRGFSGALGRTVGRLVRLGGLLVRLAPIIGLIESGTFEEDRRPRPDLPTQRVVTALGAVLARLRRDRLVDLELVATVVTDIIIGRHRSTFLSEIPVPRSVRSGPG